MKEFNVTGVCVPSKHYMVDINKKLDEIIRLIEKDKYFTINRARQYGKTTTFAQLYNKLQDTYLVLKISFEGIGDTAFSSEYEFIDTFKSLVSKRLKQIKAPEKLISNWEDGEIPKMEKLSDKITQLVEESSKEIILLIDEVDKSSDNQIFLNFLGMLRNKYLDRTEGLDKTFKSVVLAGVYDVKNLKLKFRQDDEKKYNSPWNIASDFEVDMSFDVNEIETMLIDYTKVNNIHIDTFVLSKVLFEHTRGYPFLVSKLCKIIDEKLGKEWSVKGVDAAVKIILDDKNTLFDDLIKNLENDCELYNLVYDILIHGKSVQFNPLNPVIEKGLMFGIFSKKDTNLVVSNRIFELCIYNYMISKRSIEKGELVTYEYRSNFIKNGKLDMELLLTKFQEFMYEEYRQRDIKFIEREGRLLFLCFIKPIINGKGFYYIEAETRMDNRMDVVVTYGDEEHIIELKIWHGENYEKNAIEQLAGYLDTRKITKGYLISFCFNKNRQYTKELKVFADKEIFAIVV